MINYSCNFFLQLIRIYTNNFLTYFFSLFLFLAFLVKLPLYFFHIWLPKAHVEAPVVGSIFLAAILLKLGGFGVIQVRTYFFLKRKLIFLRIGCWGMLIISFICIQSLDLKVLIAFSSVAHISLGILRRFILISIGKLICLFSISVHRFSSSIIFFQRFLIYKKSNSRRLVLNKNLFRRTRLFIFF